MRTSWPARVFRPRSSEASCRRGTSPLEIVSTRQVFGSRKPPSRAARALPVAVGERIQRRRHVARVDLSNFVEDQAPYQSPPAAAPSRPFAVARHVRT